MGPSAVFRAAAGGEQAWSARVGIAKAIANITDRNISNLVAFRGITSSTTRKRVIARSSTDARGPAEAGHYDRM
jgi:hypothetical protein